jgi:flagellar protein FlbD
MGTPGTGRNAVIAVTRLDGRKIYINAELIENIEQTPDTIVSFASGHKILVRDTADDLTRRVIDYRRTTLTPLTADAECTAATSSPTHAEQS